LNVGQRKMTAEILKALLELLKLTPRYLVAFGAAAAFLLFSSADLLKKFGVLKFAEDYRPWLGLTLIVSAILFVVSIAIDVYGWIQRKRQGTQFREHGAKRLNSLTEEEKQILRFYVAKQSKTNVLRVDDGIVQGLVGAGIICRSAPIGDMLEGFAHNISDFAWEYLHEHPEVLAGTTNFYRTDKRERWRTGYEL